MLRREQLERRVILSASLAFNGTQSLVAGTNYDVSTKN
jgi:hypothetical protein